MRGLQRHVLVISTKQCFHNLFVKSADVFFVQHEVIVYTGKSDSGHNGNLLSKILNLDKGRVNMRNVNGKIEKSPSKVYRFSHFTSQ